MFALLQGIVQQQKESEKARNTMVKRDLFTPLPYAGYLAVEKKEAAPPLKTAPRVRVFIGRREKRVWPCGNRFPVVMRDKLSCLSPMVCACGLWQTQDQHLGSPKLMPYGEQG